MNAAVIIEAWRRHDNAVPPHSGLNYLTPRELKQQHHTIACRAIFRNKWLEEAKVTIK